MSAETEAEESRTPGFDSRLVRNVRRLEIYVISAPAVIIVGVQVFWPLVSFAKARSWSADWVIALTLVSAVVLVAAELLMAYWSLQVIRSGGYGIDRRRLIGWSLVVTPLLLVMLLPTTDYNWPSQFVLSVGMAWSVASAAYSLLVATLGGLVVVVLGGLVNVLLTPLIIAHAPGHAVETLVISGATGFALAIPLGFWVALLVFTIWTSGWMIRVIKEVDRAGRLSAELAIAQERLRFSRDLHDVFGRTLATVAVKSELAEGLARRGRVEQSAAEMAAVRELADHTGREVRSLARGYREADLGRELSGAQALLDSAGIRCDVIGSPPALPRTETSVVALVLREAVTNVIRHSNATVCTITFFARPMKMTIENDGVRDETPSTSDGHGLVNMAERLAEIGGTLDYVAAGGTFRVVAELPGRAGEGSSR